MGKQPASLFLYGDTSVAARSVRQAIYDGPFDVRNFSSQPVILDKAPTTADGDVFWEPVQAQVGDVIMDAKGTPATLVDGVSYLPSGCSDSACSQVYTGKQPVGMDRLVIRFKLKKGILWSDGAPLTASDSVYSFEVARDLFSSAQSEAIANTASYQAVDDSNVEWRGIPGYRPPEYSAYFFTPLPKHLWGDLPSKDLLTAERSSRLPVGWGPYVIDKWDGVVQISLHKNPHYFRSGEGLPTFDRLVLRFTGSARDAISALEAGKCDLVDETAMQEVSQADLKEIQGREGFTVLIENGLAWEHIDFGIAPADPQKASLFQVKEVRQAVAMCIDRQAIASDLDPEKGQVSNTYLPPDHPLYAQDARGYPYDPQAAASLLDSAGWRDTDHNPSTPRVSEGVPDLPQGMPFKFTYLTLVGDEQARVAERVKASLAGCGLQMEISAGESAQLFGPGPEGPVFGRKFDAAQFAWSASSVPPCFLYTSSEIPGPYPEFPRGWGGANDSGYSSPEFDQACLKARFSLPDSPEYQEAQHQAQVIFAEDLPAIPLYLHTEIAALRKGLCGIELDPSSGSSLWNLEAFNEGCSQ